MEYNELRKELAAARRLMIESYGTPAHAMYKLLCRTIEAEMSKALPPTKEKSA